MNFMGSDMGSVFDLEFLTAPGETNCRCKEFATSPTHCAVSDSSIAPFLAAIWFSNGALGVNHKFVPIFATPYFENGVKM